MTVLAQTPKTSPVVGNGINKLFNYNFRADYLTDLRVKVTEIATGNSTYHSLNFTATGLGTLGGGVVTYPDVGSAVPSTHNVVIERQVPYEQALSISQQGGFNPAVIEMAFDRMLMQIQQLQQLIIAGLGTVPGTTLWGAISGVLASQADLQAALDAKSNTGHTHTFASLTAKPATLAGYGIGDGQPLDATLTALAALNGTAGILEQTGADAFTKRAIGTAANNLIALTAAAKLPAVDGSLLTNLPGANSRTLLATLNMSTGSSWAYTLGFAGYREIICEVDGVSFSSAGALRLETSNDAGASYGTATTVSPTLAANTRILTGALHIKNPWQVLNTVAPLVASMIDSLICSDSNVLTTPHIAIFPGGSASGVLNAIRFSPSTGNGDAGETRIWGVK